MNYQNYEDYMKNIMGNYYPNGYMNQNFNYPYFTNNQNAYTYVNPASMHITQPIMPGNINADIGNMNMQGTSNEMREQRPENVLKIKKMYPDIYFLLMPMINKIVEKNRNKDITEELIESMTIEIYDNIEDDMIRRTSTITTKYSSQPTNRTPRQENKQDNNIKHITQINSNNQSSQTTSISSNSSLVQNSRKIGNQTLKDLIKILIINKILENLDCLQDKTQYDNSYKMPAHQNMNTYGGINQYNPIRQRDMYNETTYMKYPFANYFNTPYPEDECAN